MPTTEELSYVAIDWNTVDLSDRAGPFQAQLRDAFLNQASSHYDRLVVVVDPSLPLGHYEVARGEMTPAQNMFVASVIDPYNVKELTNA